MTTRDNFLIALQRGKTCMPSAGSPSHLEAPAGFLSPSVTLDCASVVWQFPLTFGTPAPSSWARDSALSPPPYQGSAQTIKQQKCHLVGYNSNSTHTSFVSLKVHVFPHCCCANTHRWHYPVAVFSQSSWVALCRSVNQPLWNSRLTFVILT